MRERIIAKNGTVFVEIDNDMWPINPREEYDYFTRIVYDHRDYCLGDEKVDAEDFTLPDNCVGYPVYANIHSGVSLCMGRFPVTSFDGCDAIIYVDRDTAVKEWGDKAADPEFIRGYLAAEVDEFSAYLSGDVWCVNIYAVPDGADPETVDTNDCELLDTCSGFYGYGVAVQDATGNVEYYAKDMPVQLTFADYAMAN